MSVSHDSKEERRHSSSGFIAISVLGQDRPGLLSAIIEGIIEEEHEIFDVQQSVVHGILSLFILVGKCNRHCTLESRLKVSLARYDLNVDVHELASFPSREPECRYIVTIVGTDANELLLAFSRSCSRLNINNLGINMISRDELAAMQFLLEAGHLRAPELREEFEASLSHLKADIVVEEEHSFRAGKRLVVFDMDSTLVAAETIDEIARKAEKEREVSQITEMAMAGKIDFRESLSKRVALLNGVPLTVLEEIADSLTFNPGALELISALKGMKCKIALVSSGFTIFTERIRERLGLDYAYGNRLEVRDGRLTGHVLEPILDADGKQRLIREIMLREDIHEEEVLVIGDGANDIPMVANAGLGIAYMGKEALRRIADGTISLGNLKTVLYSLGFSYRL